MAETLGTVASILQLVDAALRAREYIRDFRHAPEEQRMLLSEMESLSSLLKELQSRIEGNQSSRNLQLMQKPLAAFKTTMEELTDKLKPPGVSLVTFSKRVKWTLWSKRESTDYLDKFEQFKSLLNGWLLLDIWDVGQWQRSDSNVLLKSVEDATNQQRRANDRMMMTIGDAVSDQRKHIDDAERRQIIDWLAPINFFLRQADISRLRQAGTGLWFLDDTRFKQWKAGSERILWCRGMPGSGKTVLASLAVDRLEAQFRNTDIGVASIYLNHKETDSQTPSNLLASLWRQLVADKPISPSAQELHKRHFEKCTKPTFDEIYAMLRVTVAEWSKVYFVVDALDEYPEDERHILLDNLNKLGPTVSLMLTSRPHITLADLLPNVATLEIRAADEDIRKYIDERIKKSTRLSMHIRKRPEIRDEIVQKIIGTVDGMFLPAKLHADSLATKATIKALQVALANLTKDLDDIYDEAMERIDGQSEDDRKIALATLTWVANAQRVLSVAELREALAVEPGTRSLDRNNLLDISIILSVCAGLVIVDATSSVVRLIHYTTQHYLSKVRDRRFPKAHTEITLVLLTYLSFDESRNVLLSGSPSTPPIPEYVNKEFVRMVSRSPSPLQLRPWSRSSSISPFHSYSNRESVESEEDILFQTTASGETYDEHLSSAESSDSELNLPLLGYCQYCLMHAVGQPETALQDMILQFLEEAPTWYRQMASTWTSTWYRQMSVQWDAPPWHLRSLLREMSPLQFAASANLLSIAAHLLAGGISPNDAENSGSAALCVAAYDGHVHMVQLLVDGGANLDAPSSMGDFRPLHAASSRGHEDIVQLLLKRGVDVDAADRGGGTALALASRQGHVDVVRLLIENGANIVYCNGDALTAASSSGHEKVVRLLLESGAHLETLANALTAASSSGHEKVVRLLLESGAHLGTLADALCAASWYGHGGIVRLLVGYGADVNLKSSRDWQYGFLVPSRSALQAAIARGHTDIVGLLIENGANIDVNTALTTAMHQKHEGMVRVLFEAGAEMDQKTYDQALEEPSSRGIARLLIENVPSLSMYANSALVAASRWGHDDLVRRLLEAGTDPNSPETMFLFNTPLQAASRSGHVDIVRLLIAYGATVKSSRALAIASSHDHEDVVRLLLEEGPGSDEKSAALEQASEAGCHNIVDLLVDNGATVNPSAALAAASTRGHGKVVRLLLKKGSDVNEMSYLGTPLEAASNGGYVKIVRLLLENGANVNAMGHCCTPLEAASRGGHDNVIRLLVENGANLNAGALIMASHCGHERVVQLLLELGINVDAEEEIGSALDEAAGGGYIRIVRLLIDKGANFKDSKALWAASRSGRKAVAKLLLKSGAPVDGPDRKHNPLVAASDEDHDDIVEMLLENGAAINLKDSSNTNALKAASAAGYTMVVRLLLKHGAEVNDLGGRYSSALHEALNRGHLRVIRFLLEYGAQLEVDRGCTRRRADSV